MTKDIKKKKLRNYANYREWEWPNKQENKREKELGIVKDWLESMYSVGERTYTKPRFGPHPNQAPDCIVLDKNKKDVAVELSELVCEEAIRENLRGNEVDRNWQPTEALNDIDEKLKEKDKKEYHGGPYSKIIVLIYTNEPLIFYDDYKEFLASKEFKGFQRVDEAYLLFSYKPSIKQYPYIKLTLA